MYQCKTASVIWGPQDSLPQCPWSLPTSPNAREYSLSKSFLKEAVFVSMEIFPEQARSTSLLGASCFPKPRHFLSAGPCVEPSCTQGARRRAQGVSELLPKRAEGSGAGKGKAEGRLTAPPREILGPEGCCCREAKDVCRSMRGWVKIQRKWGAHKKMPNWNQPWVFIYKHNEILSMNLLIYYLLCPSLILRFLPFTVSICPSPPVSALGCFESSCFKFNHLSCQLLHIRSQAI